MKRICHLISYLLLLAMLMDLMPMSLATDFPDTSKSRYIRTKMTQMNVWQFRKLKPVSRASESVAAVYETVTLPHSCNSEDVQSDTLWRGVTEYVHSFTAQEGLYYALRLDGAAQQSRVEVNGTEVGSSRAGYSPYTVDLTDAVQSGTNTIAVYCDNREDLTQIPISADFNFCNGLHGGAMLYTFGSVYIDPAANGIDRIRVTYPNVNKVFASLDISLLVRNRTGMALKNAAMEITVLDAEGQAVKTRTKLISIHKDNEPINLSVSLDKPHLWHGIRDPYLYTVRADLLVENMVVDSAETRVGIHTYSVSRDEGFFLNGEPYPLRGMAMHQDHPDGAIAVSEDAIDESLDIATEMGCNFLRLSHYPHRDYTLRRCDELGIVVAAEIPWINHCGINATDDYFDSICQSMDAMILNGRNHASIHFWGMSNELGGTHYKKDGIYIDPQGGMNWKNAMTWNNQLYDRAKALDDTRLIGLAAMEQQDYQVDEQFKLDKWKADYISYNIYQGWYGGKFQYFGNEVNKKYLNLTDKFIALSEYGAGGNPSTHSTNAMITTQTGSGGTRHDEEYQSRFHENYLDQIQKRPWLTFTSAWALFDFAVCGRNEGGIPYINDKGLVTRDRAIKKDAFFLYKAAWRDDTPVVHLTSKRFGTRGPGRRIITAYANTDTLTLSVNGEEVQTLTSPTLAGVVWRFNPIQFEKGSHTIAISGSLNGETLTDTTVWKVESKSTDVEGIFVLQPPANASVTQGNITEALSVEAAAMDETTLHYQWYQSKTKTNKGGTPLAWENSATCRIPKGLSAGSHYFYCVVSAEGMQSVASEAATVTVYPAQQAGESIAAFNLKGTPGADVPDTLPDLTGNGNVLCFSGVPVYSGGGIWLGAEGYSASVKGMSIPTTGVWIHIVANMPNGINRQNRIAVLPGGEGLALLFHPPEDGKGTDFTLKAETNAGEAYCVGTESLFPEAVASADILRTVCDILLTEDSARVILHAKLRDGTTGEQTFSFDCPGALEMLRTGGLMVMNRPDGLRPLGDGAELEELSISGWGDSIVVESN